MPGMDTWLRDDWESFFNGFSEELSFPFKLGISYTHKKEGRLITEHQTTCKEVSYVVDNAIIDPREVLPDWLLYDFVDFLNESIHTINIAY